MGLLVEREIVGVEALAEGRGLAEAEGEAFAGDGVDGAGGVADEGDVAGGDATERAAEGDGASRRAVGLSAWRDGGAERGSARGRARRLANFSVAMKATQTSVEEMGVT